MSDQRAARRRMERTVHQPLSPFNPGSPYGVVVGVAENVTHRDTVRTETAEQLATELGDRQVGPALWIEVTGSQAVAYLAEIVALAPALAARQVELEGQLVDWPDSILVVCVAERRL